MCTKRRSKDIFIVKLKNTFSQQLINEHLCTRKRSRIDYHIGTCKFKKVKLLFTMVLQHLDVVMCVMGLLLCFFSHSLDFILIFMNSFDKNEVVKCIFPYFMLHMSSSWVIDMFQLKLLTITSWEEVRWDQGECLKSTIETKHGWVPMVPNAFRNLVMHSYLLASINIVPIIFCV